MTTRRIGSRSPRITLPGIRPLRPFDVAERRKFDGKIYTLHTNRPLSTKTAAEQVAASLRRGTIGGGTNLARVVRRANDVYDVYVRRERP